MKKLLMLAVVLFLGTVAQVLAQIPDGKNEFRLAAVNARKAGLDANAGRGIWVAVNPDLDKDGKPEILITTYSDGGRVFVFEVTANDQLEFVWASPKLVPDDASESAPRAVITGDIDNNGRQEIIFNIGFDFGDPDRGIYIYEHDGVQGSDNYGTQATAFITPEQVDPDFAAIGMGRTESGWLVGDIDGDNRQELVWCPRALLNPDVNDLYIMQVTGGEWRLKNANLQVEYEYKEMAKALPATNDGYAPVGVAVGDIDSDGKKELAITGWTGNARGGAVGFVQINGPDSYQAGSIVPLASPPENIFNVKAKPLIVNQNGTDYLFIQRYFNLNGPIGPTPSDIITLDGVIDDAFIDASNIKIVLRGHGGVFSIWGFGDQDHGTGADGFDFYLSTGPTLVDYEYKGTGSIIDSTSYNRKQIYDIRSVYTTIGGLFDEIFVFPGMDLDKDGNRDIVASWKGNSTDAIGTINVGSNSFNVFVFEWGDSTKSIDLKQLATGVQSREWVVITPEDYDLAQNYPNPFNPSTTIEFTLPLNKLINLRIYDMTGREVRALIAPAEYAAGKHAVVWDGKDNHGQAVSSGQYIYRLEFGSFVKSKIMTLVK